MIKSRKQMYLVIGAFALVLLLGTTTYAFFNYTRTGAENLIQTGRISFSSNQGPSINLTNIFPVDVSNGIPNNDPNVGSVTINITGDTEYTGGIEYLVTAVNVQNTVGTKQLPISIDVSVGSNTVNNPATTLGTVSDDYFTLRGDDTSYYKVLASDVIENNEQLVVGYIASGQDGVDGNIIIKAYIDKEKVGISDTYPTRTVRTVVTTGYSSSDCETVLTGAGVSGANAGTYCDTASDLQDAIDNEDLTDAQISALVIAGIVDEYTDGTPSSFGEDRTIFTTQEWNSLQTNGVSFQVKVEANEGTWVDAPALPAPTCPGPQCVYTEGTNSNTIGQSINGTLGTDYFTNYNDFYNEVLINYAQYIGSGPFAYTFLGHILDGDTIIESYACGVVQNNSNASLNNTLFCLRGGVDESSLTDKPIYTENVTRLNTLYPSCNTVPDDDGSYGECVNSSMMADLDGYAMLESSICDAAVHSGGSSYCN